MRKRLYYLDYLRIFSMFAVVFLHTVSDILRINYNEPVWHFSNIFSTLFSTSVPIFFMISGVLLLSDERSSDVSFVVKNRLKKICVPFLFWSLFAIIYYFVIGYQYYDKFNYEGLFYRLKHFLNHPSTIHFWFMYALIPMYVILPFIKIIIDNVKKKHKIYMLVLWLIFTIFLVTAENMVTKDYKMIFIMDEKYSLNLFNGYLGFFILGYYLNKYDIKIKNKWLILFIALDLIFVSVFTFYLTRITGGYFEGLKTYNGVFTASMSVAIFLLFKNLFYNKENIRHYKFINLISETSFVIYLVHNLIIHFMNLNYYIVPNAGIGSVIIRFVVVYLLSLILTLVLRNIKPLCFITTGVKYRGLKKNEKN